MEQSGVRKRGRDDTRTEPAWKGGALVYPAIGNADIGRNTNPAMYVNSISVHSLAFI
jgi:hypothetical protein